MASPTITKPEHSDKNRKIEIVYKNPYNTGYKLVCVKDSSVERDTLKYTLHLTKTVGEEGCTSQDTYKICELELSLRVGNKRATSSDSDMVLILFKYYEYVGLNQKKEIKIYNEVYEDNARNLSCLTESGNLTEVFYDVVHKLTLKLCKEVIQKDFFSMKDGLEKLQLIPELLLLIERVKPLPYYALGVV